MKALWTRANSSQCSSRKTAPSAKSWSRAKSGCTTRPVTITLLSAQPTRDGKAYTWNARFTLTRGEFMASKDKVLEVPESGRENVNERTLRGVYENGAWKLTGMKSESEASASASAS